MARFTLKRHEKIVKSTDFLAIYKKGAKKESPHFRIALMANGRAWCRLGITASKKTGNSVQRNHMKRCLREYFRLHKYVLPAATDIIFTVKSGADHLRYTDIAVELNSLFRIDDTSPNADA